MEEVREDQEEEDREVRVEGQEAREGDLHRHRLGDQHRRLGDVREEAFWERLSAQR